MSNARAERLAILANGLRDLEPNQLAVMRRAMATIAMLDRFEVSTRGRARLLERVLAAVQDDGADPVEALTRLDAVVAAVARDGDG